jgi:DegV family protein with EDD domain
MIRISTDSTSDLAHLYKEKNVAVMPICVVLDNEVYSDGVDVFPSDIYKHVEETGRLPKTSARNTFDYQEFFKDLTKDGDTVIHIAFSSGLSTCCNCAIEASKNFENVYVLDSKSLSTGCGLLVMKAFDLLEEGKSAQEIVDTLNGLVDKVQASFIVSTIEYLYKGGRCGMLSSIIASVLRIMPSLYLKDGKIVAGKKYMGNILKNADKYVLDTLKKHDDYDKRRVFITYTEGTDERIVKKVEETLRANSDFEEIIHTYAGATVTCHCGKGTIGILYIDNNSVSSEE